MTARLDSDCDVPPVLAGDSPVYVLPEVPGAQPRRRQADIEHDLFATIVEDAFSEILVFDAETLTLLLCNRSARNNLGYGAGEIADLKITDLAAEFTAERIKAIHKPLLEGTDSRTVAYMSYRRKGGTFYPVEVHSRASNLGGRKVIFQIVIDQTELKREQARADLVSSIERDAAEACDSAAFLDQVLVRLCRHFACQIATVHFWKRQSEMLEPSRLWHVERPASWQEAFRKATEALKTPSGQGLAGRAHSRRRPVMTNNPGKDAHFQRRVGPGAMPVSHGFALPVLVNGDVAAVLELYSSQPTSADIWANLAQLIGEQVSRLYERKCIEDGANESRARFDAAVNGANVGLWDYNYKSGLFFLSQRCKEILHICDDAAPPSWKTFGANIHPDDIRHTAMAMKAHVIRRTPYDVEYRYRLADGSYIWLHARAQGVWDEQGAIIRTAGTIEDISGEKESESVQREVLTCIAASHDTKIVDALDRVCEYLKLDMAVVSHVTDDLFEVHYRSSGESGPALHSTVPLADTLCSDVYSGDAVQAFADLNFSPLAEHRARQEYGVGAYIGSPIFAKGLRFGTLSFQAARPRPAFTAPEIDMVRLLARWIGEEIGRASHLARLIEDDMHKSAKLACTADALLTIDQTGRIEDANQVACDMFLMQPDEMHGMMVGELLPTAQTFSHPDGRLIPLSQRQDVALKKDGQRISVLLNIAEMRMADRTIYTIALSDLTDVKQAETAKREFVSVVSHELRTPLTSIRGALSLIVNETTGPLTPESAKLAVIAQRNCERLLRLVNDILDMEKLETGKFEVSLHPVDLAEWLPDVAAAHAAYAERFDTAFELSLEPGLAPVIADGDRLMQVMANLLSNAAKFTRPGTRVLVSATAAGKHVHIAVRDHGNGIPENIRDRIFEKFTQGQSANTREREGSGLGLSIARHMILLMNGNIGFISEPDGGTTFYVDLPCVERLAPQPELEWADGPVRARLAQQMLSRRAWETLT